MMNRLLSNLHPAINSDPQKLNAISITGSGTVIIKDSTMQLIGTNASAQFDVRSYTLGSLATAISAVSGFSATCLQQSTLSASVLVSGTFSVPSSLTMFTSFLWQILKPVALALASAVDAENSALFEMILNTSDGAWLDSFGEIFGVTRELGEPDQLYAIRIFDLSVASRANNMAIQKALQDLQYNATVVDGSGTSFIVNVVLPSSPPNGYIYTTAQMRVIIDQIRLAGVTYSIQSKGSLVDAVTLTDSITSSKSSAGVKYGTGRKWGQGVWGK